jgi:UDP-GlcNAc:undecaprenyl-phosphate GlcNAc-1-phosphate transferase
MLEYLLVFFIAVTVTYLLAVVARELAMWTGAYARVRDRDVHEVPIPYFGGVAMLAGLAMAVLVASKLPGLANVPTASEIFRDAWIVVLGGALICALGVIDDIFEIDAVTKFAGEVLVAGFVVTQGIQLLWLPLPGERSLSAFSLDGSQAALLTVLIIVTTVNAVNFVDGLDGLAAGVVGIGAVAFFTYSVLLTLVNNQESSATAAILTAALAGACIGFLPHNFYPARMFMGDSGALLIGFMLSCSAITLTGQFSVGSVDRGLFGADASLLPAILPLILPVAVLIVPFVDLVLAVVRRTRAGRSPFSPDKKHMHHRLLEIGHSQRRAVLIMYLWAGLVAFGVVVLSLFSGWWSAVGLAAMAGLAVLLTFGVPGHGGIINAEEQLLDD